MEAYTEDARLNGYIEHFDRQLWGSKRVRMLALTELKSHLLESKERLKSQALDDSTASKAAVAALEDANQWIRSHNSTLLKTFARRFFLSFIIQVLICYCMNRYVMLRNVTWLDAAIIPFMISVFFSFVEVFVRVEKHRLEDINMYEYEVYNVDFRKPFIALGSCFLIISSIYVYVEVLQKFNSGLISLLPFLAATSLGMLLVSTIIGSLAFKITVTPSELVLRRLLWIERISLSEIKIVKQTGIKTKLFFLKNEYSFVYTDANGTEQALPVTPMMVNFDRLYAQIREHSS